MANARGGKSATKTKIVEVPQVDTLGHKQPQNLDMEAAILGALMIEQEAYAQVCELLKPESFYDHRHQLIYRAIQTLNVEQRPVDIITVNEQLDHDGVKEEAGGDPYILQLSANVASSAHIVYHAKIVAQKYLARQLITLSSFMQTMAFDSTVDVADLMQEVEGRMFEISQNNLKKEYTQINPVIGRVYELLQKAAARTDGLSGLSTGFD